MSLQVGALIFFVNDLEKMKIFFRDVLGLELFAAKPDWAGFKAGKLLIELFGPGHRTPDVGVSKVPGVKDFDVQPLRISFQTEDIETDVADLPRKGAHLLTSIGSEGWGKYVWLADPEGYQHQIWEPSRNEA